MFELRNIPFHAYGVNHLDIVEAWADHEELKPIVRRVVGTSGHRTLRVIFLEEAALTLDERIALLQTLNTLGCTFECATESFFALDIEPTGDYLAVREKLDAWEAQNLLGYETCEARVPGSFDQG